MTKASDCIASKVGLFCLFLITYRDKTLHNFYLYDDNDDDDDNDQTIAGGGVVSTRTCLVCFYYYFLVSRVVSVWKQGEMRRERGFGSYPSNGARQTS